MARKEFIKLMEENIRILDCLADRIKRDPSRSIGYTRQQLTILIRLYVGGRALLKDIARREQVPTPNLCMLFRKLEKDGLVVRDIDENDRRNTWYDLSPHGRDVAIAAKDSMYNAIEGIFSTMSRDDEHDLIQSLKTMNSVLRKMEEKNAK